jgi:hypothetical protein
MITFVMLICVVVVTAVLFGLWLLATIMKFIWRLIAPATQSGASKGSALECPNPACRTGNPVQARFCRRCGSNLREAAFAQQQRKGPGRYNPQQRPRATVGAGLDRIKPRD